MVYLQPPDGKELARKLLSQGLNVVIVARFGLSLTRRGNMRHRDAKTIETSATWKGDEPVFAETLKDMPNRVVRDKSVVCSA